MAVPKAKYQHEPVNPPAKWAADERRFAFLIDKLFDQVYRKLGEYNERLKAIEDKIAEMEEET